MDDNFVMDKDGNRIVSFVYDDWNEYVMSWILCSYGFEIPVSFSPILSDDYKKTECKYESLYHILKSVDENISPEKAKETIDKIAKDTLTNDTYFVLVNFTYFYGDQDSVNRDKERFNKTHMSFTEGYEHNPVKAFFRMQYFYNVPSIVQEIVNIYWIYYLSSYVPNEVNISDDNIHKVNTRLAVEYVHDFVSDSSIGTYFDPLYERLYSIVARKDEYLTKEIQRLKEEHQKEIEELLSPDGDGYKVVKERFEKMQSELH